jgi:hypothetical protein
MPLASPPAEPCFELNEVYFRRAWGMTAKDGALPVSPVAGVSPCALSPEIERLAIAGMGNLKNMAEQQAGYGEQKDGVPIKKTRYVKNTLYPRSGRDWRVSCLPPQDSGQGSIHPKIERGAGVRCPDFWQDVCSGEPWLEGVGASRKASGGTRSAKGQARMGDGQGARIVRAASIRLVPLGRTGIIARLSWLKTWGGKIVCFSRTPGIAVGVLSANRAFEPLYKFVVVTLKFNNYLLVL